LRASSSMLWMLIGLFCLEATNLQGQLPRENGEIEEVEADSLREERLETKDPFIFDPGKTIRVFYPTARKPEKTIVDTIFGPEYLQYDPARRNVDIGNLTGGYVGSPVLQTYYNMPANTGFEIGHRAYQAYKIDLDTLPFYESEVAYTDVFYAQGASQVETQTEANFGTRFGNQYISINYRRINNTGQLNSQRALHTALALGYHYAGKKSQLTIAYGSNVVQDQYNNGITTDSLFGADLASIGSNIPVFTTTAENRHQMRSYSAHFNYQPGSISFIDSWRIHTRLNNSYVKVFDNQPNPDAYGPLFIDQRGLRQFIRWSKLTNKFEFSKESSEILDYSAGLQINYVSLDQEPRTDQFFEWYAYSHLQLQFTDQLLLKANARFGAQNNQPEYQIKGEVTAGNDDFSLKGIYNSSSTVPDLVERRLYLRNDILFSAPTSNIFHNQIGGQLNIEPLNIEAEVFYHNIDNFRYWVRNQIAPNVTNLNLLQLKINHQWQWKSLVNENSIAYQLMDQSQLPLPEWQGRHSLFLNTKIFKQRMHVRTGLELRHYLNYTAPQYQPFYGSFFTVADAPFDSTPFLLDYFLAFDVQSFHVLLRLENMNSFITPTRFYTHYRHPSNPFSFRLALRWSLNG